MTNGRGCDCEEFEKKIRADEREKVLNEVEDAMYHQCFECDNNEDMQKWESGNWIRYKLFENVMGQLRMTRSEVEE